MLHINQRTFRRNINSCNPPVISGELHCDRTAVAAGITAHGYAPALALCRKLLAAGHNPRTRLELYRENGTLALRIRTIGEGAQLTVEDNSSTGRPRFTPVREERRCTASPMLRNGPGLGGGCPRGEGVS